MSEIANRAKLMMARRGARKELAQTKLAADTVKTAVSPVGLLYLFSQISLIRDPFFAVAIAAAIIKDISDISIQIIPVVGQAVGPVITIITTIFIAICLFLAEGMKAFASRKMAQKIFTVGAGGVAELLLGINFLPIQTMTLVFAYMMVLNERRQKREIESKEQQLTLQEQQALNIQQEREYVENQKREEILAIKRQQEIARTVN